MKYTLGTGAKACGVSRTTIFRAIKTGKISASKDVHGVYVIEPAELHRVYPPATEKQELKPQMDYHTMGGGSGEVLLLQEQIARLQEERERERNQLQEVVIDLRGRLNQSEKERREAQEKITAILTNQSGNKSEQGFFKKLFSK